MSSLFITTLAVSAKTFTEPTFIIPGWSVTLGGRYCPAVLQGKGWTDINSLFDR